MTATKQPREVSVEMKLLAIASIIALFLSLSDALYLKAKHSEMMADILAAFIPHAEAATNDPCAASDPFGVGDPTPDDPEACTAFWDAQKENRGEVTFYAPAGFPCHEQEGTPPCPSVYKYTTTPDRAVSIWRQVFKHWLGW